MIVLLIGGIGCFMVTDISAMIVAKKTQLIPKIRMCFQGSLANLGNSENIKNLQADNTYYMGAYKEENRELLQQKLEGQKILSADLVNDDHYNESVYKAICILEEFDWKIFENNQKIMELKKENEVLEKKHRDWVKS